MKCSQWPTLTVLLLAAATWSCAAAAAAPAAPIVLQGPTMRLAISPGRGGTLTDLAVRDWAGEHEISAAPIADVVAVVDGKTYRLSAAGGAKCALEEAGPMKWRVAVEPVRLRAVDGTACPIVAQQQFTVYGEGAVFCDLTLRAPAGSDAKLQRCQLQFAVSLRRLTPVRFYVKPRGLENGQSEYIAPQVSGRMARYPVTHAGFMFGQGRGFCAAAEFVLENQRRLAGDGHPAFVLGPLEAGDRKTFVWLLHDGASVSLSQTALARPEGFRVRWGICTSAIRQRSIAIGQRVAHWQEGKAALMSFPSDSAVEAMALAGVSVNVLHLYWSKGWARDFVPVDEAEMRRWVRACRSHGIRPVLYVVPVDAPGVDGINREWYQDYGVGGLYFDFGAVGYNTAHYKADYPAMQYLELARHYRQVVGPAGLMISHGSGQFPDLVFFRHIDAYLPGEVRSHRHMLDSWEQASWYSGQAVAVSHPWCEYRLWWQTRRAAAVFAAIGAFPHVLFGRGTHEDNNYHRCVIFPAHFTLPYWQMLRTFFPADWGSRPDGGTAPWLRAMYNEATQRVARVTGPDVHWVVYSASRDGALAIVSNLGDPARVRLGLDEQALSLRGQYEAAMIFDDVLRRPRRFIWAGGSIDLGTLRCDRYRAVVLARPGTPLARHVRRALADIDRLRRQLTCKTPPGPVPELNARSRPGLVQLTWQPARGEAHVCEYRIWRSDLTRPLPAAEECTYARDFTAPPGRTVTYTVRAADIAGNIGPAATTTVSVAKGDLLCLTFDRGTDGLSKLAGEMQPADGWLQLGARWPVASPKGDTFTFPPARVRFLRIYFSGGRFNYDNAHIIEAAVFAPDGKKLPVAAVKSSGDDPGHPASDVIDGVTDQTHNGWWSDRRKGIPAWVTLDLGRLASVAKVWVLTYADGRRWYDYRVELSADGKTWRTVGQSARPHPFSLCLGPELEAAGPIAISVVVRQVENFRVPGGLVFAADRRGHGYALVLDDTFDGWLRLVKLDGERYSILAGHPFGYSIYRPLPHLIEVRLRGRHVECWCDGRHVFDADLPNLPGRCVGLVAKGGRLLFDNLQAWRLTQAGEAAGP